MRIFVLTAIMFFVFQANAQKVLGECLGKGEAESSELKENTALCEAHDDAAKQCQALPDKCQWVERPKVCEAKRVSDDRATTLCRGLTSREECDRQSLDCHWAYRARNCNPKDEDSERDAEFCERFDGKSDECKKNSDKCVLEM